MNWDTYLRLSVLMLMAVAAWGAWMPVLALRLLGPLKMTGKQAGWIYATFPLACIFAPFVSGYLADRWFNAEWIMLVCHGVGGSLLLLAARQTKFPGMFFVMLAYSVFYTATLPLLNKLVFQHLREQATWIFLWAPVGWAVVGYFLAGLRRMRKTGGDGNDCLYLAAVLSGLTAVVCFFQLPTEPKPVGNPMLEALAMLKHPDYLIFTSVELVVSGTMQFYFLGTGQFMQDKGVHGKNISAAMGLAQAVQAIATIVLLDCFRRNLGDQWTFVIGASCWTVLYLVYVMGPSSLWIVLAQSLYGLAYVFFMIGGQMFVGDMAPGEIGASAQSLFFVATNGIGMLLGTRWAGIVMEKNVVAGKFQWSKIWTVPLVVTLAGAIVFAAALKIPNPADFRHGKPVFQARKPHW